MAHTEWAAIDNQIDESFADFYCAFLDILGYKEKSAQYFRREYNLAARIDRALRTAETALGLSGVFMDFSQLKVEFISDSILMFHPVKEAALDKILVVTMIFVANLAIEDLFVRGGISRGPHVEAIIRERYPFIASLALQKAYRLEHEEADFPRILVDPAIVGDLSEKSCDPIIMDGEWPMVHYAHQIINRQGQNADNVEAEMTDIANARDNATDPKAPSKYQWVLDYFYWTLTQTGKFDSERFRHFASEYPREFFLL